MFSRFVSQVSENVGFFSVVVIVAVLIAVFAKAAEATFLKGRLHKVSTAKYLSICGMFSALAAILMLFEFPLAFLAPGFYKLDFSELPVMIGGMYLGPCAAVVIEFVKIMLKLILKGTTTAFVGDFANFVVGCALVLPAVIIYHTSKTKKRALIGLITGTIILAVFGSAFNAVYLLPAFSKLYGMPLETIIEMGSAIHPGIKNTTTFVIMCVFPLNIIKGTAVSVLTMLLYKHISRLLHGLTS